MKCPDCNTTLKVWRVEQGPLMTVRRERLCVRCGKRWFTTEQVAGASTKTIENDYMNTTLKEQMTGRLHQAETTLEALRHDNETLQAEISTLKAACKTCNGPVRSWKRGNGNGRGIY